MEVFLDGVDTKVSRPWVKAMYFTCGWVLFNQLKLLRAKESFLKEKGILTVDDLEA